MSSCPAVALADAPNGEASFSGDSESVVARLGSDYFPSRAYLDVLPLATARSTVFDRFAAGTAFIDYLGHGGLDRLAAGGLLTSADAAGLSNGARLPVLTAMTCAVNRFTVPGVPPLGAVLVNRAGGGAAAVWSPSALSIHAEATLLARQFYGIIAMGQAPRIGDGVRQALTAFKDAGGNPSMLEIYVLLGDPALRTKAAPRRSPNPPGPPSGGLE